MIHEPHNTPTGVNDRTKQLAMMLGIPGTATAGAIRAAAIPLPRAPARLFVNWAESEYHGREVTLVSQKNLMALVHVEDHIHLIIDTCHLLVLPGSSCA